MEHEIFITLVVAIATFLAGVLAASIAHGSKISEFRQIWINSLRNDIATYLTNVNHMSILYDQYNNEKDKSRKYEIEKEFTKYTNEANIFRMRIVMMFKPLDQDEFLGKLLALMKIHKDQYRFSMIEDCLEHARTILKAEWEVTKHPWQHSLLIQIKRNKTLRKLVEFWF
jgi:hypothetical protein